VTNLASRRSALDFVAHEPDLLRQIGPAEDGEGDAPAHPALAFGLR